MDLCLDDSRFCKNRKNDKYIQRTPGISDRERYREINRYEKQNKERLADFDLSQDSRRAAMVLKLFHDMKKNRKDLKPDVFCLKLVHLASKRLSMLSAEEKAKIIDEVTKSSVQKLDKVSLA